MAEVYILDGMDGQAFADELRVLTRQLEVSVEAWRRVAERYEQAIRGLLAEAEDPEQRRTMSLSYLLSRLEDLLEDTA